MSKKIADEVLGNDGLCKLRPGTHAIGREQPMAQGMPTYVRTWSFGARAAGSVQIAASAISDAIFFRSKSFCVIGSSTVPSITVGKRYDKTTRATVQSSKVSPAVVADRRITANMLENRRPPGDRNSVVAVAVKG